jgi:hypothetical protein
LKSLGRIEQKLDESTEVAERTSAELAIQGETVEALKAGVKVVEDDIKKTHRLLDRFARWANFGFASKSRNAGRKGNKELEKQSRMDALRLKALSLEHNRTSKATLPGKIIARVQKEVLQEKAAEATQEKGVLLTVQEDTEKSALQDSDDEVEDEHLDRIAAAVARLHAISLAHGAAIQEQTKVISKVEVMSTGQLKRARKAQARTSWHMGKKSVRKSDKST